jgi:hypothetical protein
VNHVRMTPAFALAMVLLTAATAFANEKPIKQGDVPDPVLAAVEAKYPNAKLTHFAKEVEDGKTLYEVAFTVGTTHAEVSVSPEGKIVLEETTITLKDLPDAVRNGLAASRYGKAKVLRVERVLEAAKPGVTTFELMVEQSGKKHELEFDGAGKLTRVE